MSTLWSTWPYETLFSKERLERMRDEMNDLIEMLEILLDRELLDSIEGEKRISRREEYTPFKNLKK